MTSQVGSPRDGDALLAARRAPRGQLRPRDVLFRLYLCALFGPAVLALATLPVELVVSMAGTELPLGAAGAPATLAALTLLALVALATLVRTAVWHGPVVLGPADVAWLLSSPQPRGQLLRPRLAGTLRRSALIGGLAGGLVGIASAEVVAASQLGRGGAGALAGAALGLIGQAAAWWVVADEARSRLVLRATVPVGAAVLVLAASAVAAPALGWLLAWSGPWGWAALAMAAPPPAAFGGSGLLAATAGGAAMWALRTSGRPPVDELARRSVTGTGVAAAMFFGDTAGAREVAREAVDVLRGPSRLRLPTPASSRLAVPWRDATVALRRPGQLVGATLLAATAAGAVATGLATVPAWDAAVGPAPPEPPAGAWLLPAGILGTTLAARGFLGPLRSALAWPFGNLVLPWTDRALLSRHLWWPTAALAVASVAGVVLAWLLPWPVDWTSASAAPVTAALAAGLAWVVGVAPAMVALTAIGALHPPPEPVEAAMARATETAAMQESLRSGLRASRPLLAVMAPTVLVIFASAAPAAGTTAMFTALAALLGAGGSALAWLWLGRRRLPWDAPPG